MNKVYAVIARSHQEFTWWVFDRFAHPLLNNKIVKQGNHIIVNDDKYIYASDVNSIRAYHFDDFYELDNCYMRHDYKEIKDRIKIVIKADKANGD